MLLNNFVSDKKSVKYTATSSVGVHRSSTVEWSLPFFIVIDNNERTGSPLPKFLS
jgi:hypothetical protein